MNKESETASNKNSRELYAGDVSPLEAWGILQKDKKSYLVDVRTLPEWSFTGCPDLRSVEGKFVRLSWVMYPTMSLNNKFIETLQKEIESKDSSIFFICRCGGRSKDAAIAMASLGYNNCFNIADGFEGKLNSKGHRGTKNGWKVENLPWEQT